MKLTEWLAIYASVISTIVFAWNILQNRPKAKTKIILGVSEGDVGLYIIIQNRTNHKINISGISLLYQYKKVGFLEIMKNSAKYRVFPDHIGWVRSGLKTNGIDDGCPAALESRNSHEVFVPEKIVMRLLGDAISKKLVAVSQDKLWQNSYSPKFEWKFSRKKSD